MAENTIRKQIAEVLMKFTQEDEWDPQLWSRFEELKRHTPIDTLIAMADEELIHYSGCFTSRNLLGHKIPPNPSEMKEIRATLIEIARKLSA